MEAKLKEKNSDDASSSDLLASAEQLLADGEREPSEASAEERPAKRIAIEKASRPDADNDVAVISPTAPPAKPPTPLQPATTKLAPAESRHALVSADALLDTYFTRFHGKPHHILDEQSTRQRVQLNQLPEYLLHAISAVAARLVCQPLSLPLEQLLI